MASLMYHIIANMSHCIAEVMNSGFTVMALEANRFRKILPLLIKVL